VAESERLMKTLFVKVFPWMLLVAAVAIGVVSLWKVVSHSMMHLKTQDRFAILLVQFDGAVEVGGSAETIRSNACAGYKLRTGQVCPTDAWKRPIEIIVTISGPVCSVKLRSAGYDGIYGTNDDLSRSMNFRLPKTDAMTEDGDTLPPPRTPPAKYPSPPASW
jgi:hypothetical protein